jgi:hypothetical protein
MAITKCTRALSADERYNCAHPVGVVLLLPAIDLFVRCYNSRQLRKRKYPPTVGAEKFGGCAPTLKSTRRRRALPGSVARIASEL